MALIKCSECGKEISDKAKECNSCGCPVNDTDNNNAGSIKINYPKTWGLLIPNLKVYFEDKLITEIKLGNIYELKIDKNGTFLFEWGLSKVEVEVEDNLNYEITINIDRGKGKISAKVDSWE